MCLYPISAVGRRDYLLMTWLHTNLHQNQLVNCDSSSRNNGAATSLFTFTQTKWGEQSSSYRKQGISWQSRELARTQHFHCRAQDQYLVGELILQATQHRTGKTKQKVTAYFLTTLAILEKKWDKGKLWRHWVSSVLNHCTPSNYGGLL